MKRYTYEGESISVNLENGNGFIITAIAKWDNEEKLYYAKFYINRSDVDMLDLVEEKISINAEMKTLRVLIAQYITNKFKSGFYDFYMNRYDEQLKCFDIGSAIFDAKKEV